MRTSILAAAVLAIAAAAHSAPQKPGVDRWPVKTAPPMAGPSTLVPIATLIGLPPKAGVLHNDKRYQDARIPGPALPGVVEGASVTTTGWLCLVALEADGDYHIQLAETAACKTPVLIVETPDPKYVTDPTLKAQAGSVRSWLLAHPLNGKTPSSGGTAFKAPAQVTVTGALFLDDSHISTPARGKRGMKAPGLWELHPVISIGPAS